MWVSGPQPLLVGAVRGWLLMPSVSAASCCALSSWHLLCHCCTTKSVLSSSCSCMQAHIHNTAAQLSSSHCQQAPHQDGLYIHDWHGPGAAIACGKCPITCAVPAVGCIASVNLQSSLNNWLSSSTVADIKSPAGLHLLQSTIKLHQVAAVSCCLTTALTARLSSCSNA